MLYIVTYILMSMRTYLMSQLMPNVRPTTETQINNSMRCDVVMHKPKLRTKLKPKSERSPTETPK